MMKYHILYFTCVLAMAFCVLMIFINVDKTVSLVNAQEPNQPQQIVFPKDTKLPVKYKCPTHGITEKILTLEIEGVQAKYCNVCVMRFVAALLDLNIPKLEIVNENALDPNEAKK